MSPRPADPSVRTALIERAAGIVATEGRAALTLRRLARDVGTSTMAVYTHFGSMEQLRREVRVEGFARLRARLEKVRRTRDPVADLIVLGAAYYLSGVESPNLYRAMFLDGPVDEEDLGTGLDTFMFLVEGVTRCRDAGRLPAASDADPAELAVDLWAMSHGLLSLQLAGMLPEEQALGRFDAVGGNLLAAWGADPALLRRSHSSAVRRIGQVADSSSSAAW